MASRVTMSHPWIQRMRRYFLPQPKCPSLHSLRITYYFGKVRKDLSTCMTTLGNVLLKYLRGTIVEAAHSYRSHGDTLVSNTVENPL